MYSAWLYETSKKNVVAVALGVSQTLKETSKEENDDSSAANANVVIVGLSRVETKNKYKTTTFRDESEIKKNKRRKGGEDGRFIGFCIALDDSCLLRPIGRRQENKRRDEVKKRLRLTRIIRDFEG